MNDELLSLRLIGYYRCAPHGFAMPLYGQNEGANTLYIAHCSIPGDRRSTIDGFEPVDVDDQRRLPDGESVAVAAGERWRDVFLWNEAVYVGTPEQLWRELTPLLADVEARAPLSLLDLAIHAGREEVAALAPTALAFARQRFGDERARSWRRQFLRQQVEAALRHALADKHNDDALFRAVSLFETTPDVLTFDLPDMLATAAASSETVEGTIDQVKQLAAFLGASLTRLPDNARFTPSTKTESTTHVATTTVPNPTFHDDLPVLIIAVGKRARDVVNHLRSAKKRDLHTGDGGWEIISGSRTSLVIPKEVQSNSIIVLVLGDDEKDFTHFSPDFEKFLVQQAQAGAIILLAPALPASHPSMLFDYRNIGHGPERSIHAILDTTIARSPFWWGKPKRSFDRRISDVLKLAITAAQAPIVYRELLNRRLEETIPILSIGVISNLSGKEPRFDGPRNLHLGSEASWVADDPKRSDPAVLFSVRVSPDEINDHSYETQLIVEGHKRENRFPEFAGRVLSSILGRRNKQPLWVEQRIEQQSYLPDEVTQALRTPEYAGAFAIALDSGDRLALAVTGEAPSLDAVEQADRHGWKIARYTDSSSLRRLFENVNQSATFPDEIDMGPVHSSEINRRLATRGVDQRDVIRISYDLLSEWLGGLPAAERDTARQCARPLRSATRPYGETENDHLLTREYVLGSDPAARKLLSLISSQGKSLPESRSMKRSSDLIKCWTPPLPGLQRHAIVDGAVPIILLELLDDEVPVQELFVIDGDVAVPALFRSRVFAIWARATLPAASSWMARFSVANTFGGFPIVKPFRIVDQEGSNVALVMHDAPYNMGELAQEVGLHIQRALGSQPSGNWKEAHRVSDELPAMRRLNEIVLNVYGLPEDADDIRILRRLRELNAAFERVQ